MAERRYTLEEIRERMTGDEAVESLARALYDELRGQPLGGWDGERMEKYRPGYRQNARRKLVRAYGAAFPDSSTKGDDHA